MYAVIFYRDKSGKSAIADYVQKLIESTDKDSRIKLNKIYDYILYLSEAGQSAGEPYIKHLDGEIWELRLIRDRILYAAYDGKTFILLHYFVKKTQKTPFREIKQAKKNLAEYRERSEKNGE